MPPTDQQLYERDLRTIVWVSDGKDGRDSVDAAFNGAKCVVRDGDLRYLTFNDKSVSVENFLSADLSKQARYRAGVRLQIGRGQDRFNFMIHYHSIEPFDRKCSGDFRSFLVAQYPDDYDAIIKKHFLRIIASKNLIFSYKLQRALVQKNNVPLPLSYLNMNADHYQFYTDEHGRRSIDHRFSPFRTVGRSEGFSEAIGSEMWCGPSFWMLTEANLGDIRALDGVAVSILPNDIVHIKAHRPFSVGDEQEELATELRRRLFPNTYFLDGYGNDTRA